MRTRCRLIMTFDNSFSVICDEARHLGITASFAWCRIDFYYNYMCKPWLFQSYSTCAHLYMYLCMYVFKYTYIFIFVDSCKNQHQKEQKRENKLKQNPLQYRNNLGEMNAGALLIDCFIWLSFTGSSLHRAARFTGRQLSYKIGFGLLKKIMELNKG